MSLIHSIQMLINSHFNQQRVLTLALRVCSSLEVKNSSNMATACLYKQLEAALWFQMKEVK